MVEQRLLQIQVQNDANKVIQVLHLNKRQDVSTYVSPNPLSQINQFSCYNRLFRCTKLDGRGA